MTGRRRAQRPGGDRRGAAAAVFVLALLSGATGSAEASFQGTTGTTGNTVGAAAAFPRYPQVVLADSPSFDYRLDEPPGTGTAADATGTSPGRYDTAYAFDRPGAIADGDAALGLRNAPAQMPVVHSSLRSNPQVFTVEVWFRTTTRTGGRIVGFGNSAEGWSGNYDRHLYMRDDGTLAFGIWPGHVVTVSTTTPYNDGAWHQVDATLGGVGGLRLYVDGTLAGSDPETVAQTYDGYWRVGGDSLGGWPGQPSRAGLDGDVDEVAVYPAELSAAQVSAHHAAAAGSGYAAAVTADAPDFYWRLDDAPGTTVADSSGNGHPGTIAGGPWSGPASIPGSTGDGDGAGRFTGQGGIGSSAIVTAPTTFSEELRFRTTSTSGGELIGLGDQQAAYSSSYDRMVYLRNDGRLTLGVYLTSGALTVTTPQAWNDGAWHSLVATCGPGGLHLYVDGADQVSDPGTSCGSAFEGYWRVGGDNLGGWPAAPAAYYVTADIDDVAVYPTQLDPATVAAHAGAAAGNGYAGTVLADHPDLYWRLGDPSLAPTVADSSPHGTSGVTASPATPYTTTTGPMRAGQVATHAVHFTGSSGVWNQQAGQGPQVFTVECWFRTTTTRGGKLVGFGSSATGWSSNYDRHLYLTDDGHVVFGVNPGPLATLATSGTYTDGTWHYAAGSVGPAGMKLYVDGRLEAADPSVTGAETYVGYWRIGGDNLDWWPYAHDARAVVADIGDVAVYPTQLSDDQVRMHAYANH